MKINKAIEIYLNWKQAHTAVAYNRYKVRLDQFLDYIGHNANLMEITGDQVISFHNQMETQYSLGTVAYSVRILKNFFEFWKGRNQVNLNPKEIMPIRYTTPDKDIVTESDFELMSDSLNEQFLEELQKKLVIHLLWDTGMRISELAELQLKDISLTPKKGMRSAKVRTRKTMRYNLVVWGRKTDELLSSYIGIRLDLNDADDNLLVNPKTGKSYSIRTLQRWIKEIADQAMIDKEITPHSYRHAKAHYILDNQGNVRDVQALLRHVKPESSFNYLQLNQSQYLNVAERYLTT